MAQTPAPAPIRVGTAGWPLPATERGHFPPGASLLERYAQVFNAVEINSSFYRAHRPETYRRWAAAVPDGFAFSAKLPREITHRRKLAGCEDLITAFAAETSALGDKLKAVLVQLPPSLRFERDVASVFFSSLKARVAAALLCEPRHPTWFTPEAGELLRACDVARVAADPAVVPEAGSPGGAHHTAYLRLHGSPRMYHSPYDGASLEAYARDLLSLRGVAEGIWCIFDNTAEFHATPNARLFKTILDNAAVKPC